jgi:hypothetical protein
MYGLASGAMERTSMRAERSLPGGMRTMEPRSMAVDSPLRPESSPELVPRSGFPSPWLGFAAGGP